VENNPRCAKDIIDDALHHNSRKMFFLYVFGGVGIITGCAVVLYGQFCCSIYVTIAGTAISGITIPILKHLNKLWKECTTMRLIEIPLGNALTSEKTAMAIHNVFISNLKE